MGVHEKTTSIAMFHFLHYNWVEIESVDEWWCRETEGQFASGCIFSARNILAIEWRLFGVMQLAILFKISFHHDFTWEVHLVCVSSAQIEEHWHSEVKVGHCSLLPLLRALFLHILEDTIVSTYCIVQGPFLYWDMAFCNLHLVTWCPLVMKWSCIRL